MTVILAVDAAWTTHNPSGVALVTRKKSGWRACCVAPSYDCFVAYADGLSIDWGVSHFPGSRPNIKELLASARSMSNEAVGLVVLDMPVSTVPITGRRVADNSVSQSFGASGCSTHSPTSERPGQLGVDILRELCKAGYPLATSTDNSGTLRRTIETYPHPALLKLMRSNFRIQYKVSKSHSYWPTMDIRERIGKLLSEFGGIYKALRKTFGEIELDLPCATKVKTLAALKRYEDALDALVCAWVGVMYAKHKAQSYGDSTAAIWLPIVCE